jgi:hypothetical protein
VRVPTGLSSTELPRAVALQWRAVADLGHLLRFRAAILSRRRLVLLACLFAAITLAALIAPAYLPGAGHPGPGHARDTLTLLPTGLAGFQLLNLVAAVASGGGRELVPREQLVAYPVSPTTDHLGALLLAPLNIAWLVQSWTLLGATAFALGPDRSWPVSAGVLLWIAVATARAQAVAWTVEGVRRLRGGSIAIRVMTVAAGLLAAWLQLTGRLAHLLDNLPTRWFVVGLVDGVSGRWALTLVIETVMLATSVIVGGVAAHLTARLAPREESDADVAMHLARATPRSEWAMLVRIDRASVWRAVPIRRGLLVLSVGPGVVALAGALDWPQLALLPGLVASGGALLFAVNAWCLDGRGGLWCESLPVRPQVVFAARAWVCAEFLVVASAVTLAIGCLRAGVPAPAEAAAVLAGWLVVLVQVTSAALRWSLARPHPVDLRSARATPAPPLAMVAYSSRLALTTTITALVFSGLARGQVSVAVTVPVAVALGTWSWLRLRRTAAAWTDPVVRARVVTTVAL